MDARRAGHDGGGMTALRAPTGSPVLTLLSLGRALVGAAAWVAPAPSARLFGVPGAARDADGRAVMRLFGVRDLALGLALQQADPARRRDAARLGTVVDAVDVVNGLLEARRGLSRRGVLGVPVGAAVLCVAGVVALRELDAAAAG